MKRTGSAAIEGDSNGRIANVFRFDEFIHPAVDRFLRKGWVK